MIMGAWAGTKFENPEMDSFFINSQNYIDTIGKNGNPATNMELYGVTNMDSIRRIMQAQHDSAKSMQMNAVLHTTFDFRKDSMVFVTFDGRVDTSKWYMESENALILEETSGEGKGTKTKMDILTLTDNELKIKFQQENTYSTVTFKRGGK